MSESITPRQRQTASGRRAFLESFPSSEDRSEHFRDMARRSAESRVVLSGEEAAALSGAYRLLSRIAARGKIGDSPTDPKAA